MRIRIRSCFFPATLRSPSSNRFLKLADFGRTRILYFCRLHSTEVESPRCYRSGCPMSTLLASQFDNFAKNQIEACYRIKVAFRSPELCVIHRNYAIHLTVVLGQFSCHSNVGQAVPDFQCANNATNTRVRHSLTYTLLPSISFKTSEGA